ncbi:unnamed protein product [Durusdinium trenchii]|uniref:Uncharacterized protein n=1 Tax=Durusdinium trenchii TaxID=1381693 RepID=A0ABP0J5G5_9DINO
MNPRGLPCDFFVSHSWSHPFADSVAALQRELILTKESPQRIPACVFWICLFALNQHNLQNELSKDLAQMPFAYGLAKASRGVWMILDQGVEPFRRIWCLYEVQRAFELGQPLRLVLDGGAVGSPGASKASPDPTAEAPLALLVAEELQRLSAFEASASILGDKIKIWHEILNPSVKNAFPIQKFETHFEEGTCAIRGFGPSWFTHFDSRVCQLLATPVFNFCLAEGRAALALRYLGLGAQSSLEELLTCERLLATPLREAWVYNPCCGEALLLHVFSHLGDSERLSFLLKAAANPAERAHDQKQRSALHFAAKAGHCHCVQQLLDAKAAAHCPDKNGETPLQIAAYGGHLPVAELLLERKAKVDSADRDRWTPLICAARAGHEPLVELLLAQKASVQAADMLGSTALRHAQMAGHRLRVLEAASHAADLEEMALIEEEVQEDQARHS